MRGLGVSNKSLYKIIVDRLFVTLEGEPYRVDWIPGRISTDPTRVRETLIRVKGNWSTLWRVRMVPSEKVS